MSLRMNMRRKFTRAVLFLLASGPLHGVAVAAESRLGEMDDDDRFLSSVREELRQLRAARRVVFGPGEVVVDSERAYRRFERTSGLASRERIDAEFQRAIETLIEKGLLSIEGKQLISKGPSELR